MLGFLGVFRGFSFRVLRVFTRSRCFREVGGISNVYEGLLKGAGGARCVGGCCVGTGWI